MDQSRALSRFRFVLAAFIACLVASGATAFPLLWELRVLARGLGLPETAAASGLTGIGFWIHTVRWGLETTYRDFPWLAYGTDWLAFGHIVIALFFVPAWLRPETSRPTLVVGMVACLGVLPLAFICGPIRGIPFHWRLIDSSFGIFGILPLVYCWRLLPWLESRGTRA